MFSRGDVKKASFVLVAVAVFLVIMPLALFALSITINTPTTETIQYASSLDINYTLVFDEIYPSVCEYSLNYAKNVSMPKSKPSNYSWNYTTAESVWASPIINNSTVYIGSTDNKMYAVWLRNGTEKCNFTTNDDIISTPLVDGEFLFFGSNDDKFYAINTTDCSHIWNFTTGGNIASSPVASSEYVYFGSADKLLYCLNKSNGVQIWNYTTGGTVASPSLDSDYVYFGSADDSVYCLNSTDKTEIWNSSISDVPFSAPALTDTMLFVSTGGPAGAVFALNKTDGSELWNYGLGGDGYSTPAVNNGRVIVGSVSSNGVIRALNETTGALLWSYLFPAIGDFTFASPIVISDYVFVGSYSNKIVALNETDGSLLWNYTTGGDVFGSAAFAEGTLVVGSVDNSVYGFDFGYKNGNVWSQFMSNDNKTGATNNTFTLLCENTTNTLIEGTNNLLIYANNTTDLVSNDSTIYYFEDPVLSPENITQTLAIGEKWYNLTINVTTGTYPTDPFFYNFSLLGDLTNTTLMNITLSKDRLNVTNQSNQTILTLNVTTNTSLNGTYTGYVNVTREKDNLSWTIPVTLYFENLLGKVVVNNAATDPWIESTTNSGIITKAWTINNTGNYTLTNCNASIRVIGGYPNLNPYTSFNETAFTIANSSNKNVTATINNPPIGYYYQNYLYIECISSPAGAIDTLDTNEPVLAITVTATIPNPSGGSGGGGATVDVKRDCDIGIEPTQITLNYINTARTLTITNNEPTSQTYTIRLDQSGEATKYIRVPAAPPSLAQGQSSSIILQLTNETEAFTAGNTKTSIIIGSLECRDETIPVYIQPSGSALPDVSGTINELGETLKHPYKNIPTWVILSAIGIIAGLAAYLVNGRWILDVLIGLLTSTILLILIYYGGMI